MRQYLLAIVAILLVTSTYCSRTEAQARKVSSNEYAIYSVVLNSAYDSTILNRKREFPGGGKVAGLFLIQSKTSGPIDDWYIKQAGVCDKKFTSWSVKPMLDEMLANNQRAYALDKHFNLANKYWLLSAKRFASFFKNSGPFVGYEAFHKGYGQRSAYYTLSRVGFNAPKTKALVFVFENCSAICAFSRFIQLHKVQGTWKVVTEFGC